MDPGRHSVEGKKFFCTWICRNERHIFHSQMVVTHFTNFSHEFRIWATPCIRLLLTWTIQPICRCCAADSRATGGEKWKIGGNLVKQWAQKKWLEGIKRHFSSTHSTAIPFPFCWLGWKWVKSRSKKSYKFSKLKIGRSSLQPHGGKLWNVKWANFTSFFNIQLSSTDTGRKTQWKFIMLSSAECYKRHGKYLGADNNFNFSFPSSRSRACFAWNPRSYCDWGFLYCCGKLSYDSLARKTERKTKKQKVKGKSTLKRGKQQQQPTSSSSSCEALQGKVKNLEMWKMSAHL